MIGQPGGVGQRLAHALRLGHGRNECHGAILVGVVQHGEILGVVQGRHNRIWIEQRRGEGAPPLGSRRYQLCERFSGCAHVDTSGGTSALLVVERHQGCTKLACNRDIHRIGAAQAVLGGEVRCRER